MGQMADALIAVGRQEDATKLLEQTLPSMQSALGAEHPETLACMIRLGRAYANQNKPAEAETLLVRAYDRYARRLAAFPTPYDRAQTRAACTQLVQLYEQTNQSDKAAEWQHTLGTLTDAPTTETDKNEPSQADGG